MPLFIPPKGIFFADDVMYEPWFCRQRNENADSTENPWYHPIQWRVQVGFIRVL